MIRTVPRTPTKVITEGVGAAVRSVDLTVSDSCQQMKLPVQPITEILMDGSRCPICRKRFIAMTDRTSRTKLVCLKCDKIDPMQTDTVKWADSSLGRPAEFGRSAQSPRNR